MPTVKKNQRQLNQLNRQLFRVVAPGYSGGWDPIEDLTRLLAEGADVNARNKDGDTPLHAAAEFRDDMVQLLIDKGADIHARNKNGDTPLHIAIYRAEYDGDEITKQLIKAGADVNAKNKQGDTPLHEAAAQGYANTVKLLLNKGAHMDVGSKSTLLHSAAKHHNTAFLRRLLSKDADVNAKDSDGATPLHEAAENHYEGTELLLNKGADVHEKDEKGATALHKAAALGNHSIAELLLNKGAGVNTKNNEGDTPLHEAISFGNSPRRGGHADGDSLEEFAHKTVELLLEKGADPNIENGKGDTPIVLASQTSLRKLIESHRKNRMAQSNGGEGIWAGQVQGSRGSRSPRGRS